MATDARITDTVVDIADCHTTLYYLAKPPASPVLPFTNADEYGDLHTDIAAIGVTKFGAIGDQRPGYSAAILRDVQLPYRENKFWRNATRQGDMSNAPMQAWAKILPLDCKLKKRIDFVAGDSFSFKVSPQVRVLLYPFGWSTHLSLRLLGDYTLGDLSRFLRYLVNEKCIRVQSPDADPPPELSINEYFSQVATGVKADAFGGNKTIDSYSGQPVMVTTVLAKTGFGPSAKTEKDQEQKLMLELVKPGRAASDRKFGSYVYQRKADNPLRFVVADGYGRFVWLEHLLEPRGKRHTWLRCHHNNTFNALLHALHLYELIIAVTGDLKLRKNPPEPLLELVDAARQQLSSPGYRNASLHDFLLDAQVQAAIKAAEKMTLPKD